MMTHQYTHIKASLMTGIGAMLALTMLMPMTGCRGDRTDKPPRQFFPDMDDQQKLKPQSESKFYADGTSQRGTVPGTIPFGDNTYAPPVGSDAPQWASGLLKNQIDMLKADSSYSFGLLAGTTDQYVERMPVDVTKELILRGQERFDIFCSACHGYDGQGGDSGSVGRLWSIPPANLMDAKYVDRTGEFGSDGYLFHIIRDGLYTPTGEIRMPSYSHAIDEADAWGIVAYIRALQAAQGTGEQTTNAAAALDTENAANAGGEG